MPPSSEEASEEVSAAEESAEDDVSAAGAEEEVEEEEEVVPPLHAVSCAQARISAAAAMRDFLFVIFISVTCLSVCFLSEFLLFISFRLFTMDQRALLFFRMSRSAIIRIAYNIIPIAQATAIYAHAVGY